MEPSWGPYFELGETWILFIATTNGSGSALRIVRILRTPFELLPELLSTFDSPVVFVVIIEDIEGCSVNCRLFGVLINGTQQYSSCRQCIGMRINRRLVSSSASANTTSGSGKLLV